MTQLYANMEEDKF